MLSARVISALVLIPLVAATVYLGGPWFTLLVAVAAALATFEFLRIVGRLGAHPFVAVGTALSAALVVAAHYSRPDIGAAIFVVTLAALMVWHVAREDFRGFLLDWSSTLIAAAYVGGMLSHFVLLRNLPQGTGWVALAALTTWAADTAAYLVGRAWGHRPFFPKVSPRKTLEGAIAALVTGILVCMAISVYFLHAHWLAALGLGVLLSLAIIFGDLSESLIKRQAKVKDSGNLIPGHGGALDRVDSLLFAAVAVYYFVLWFI